MSFDADARGGSAGPLGAGQVWLDRLNGCAAGLSAVAMGIAACVLTWEVIGRYFLAIPSEWQDELSVFLLVGATFLSASWIQARRGHVAIDTLARVLPLAANRVRRLLADLASLAFCAFFCWKSWTLWLEAWTEGQTTASAWSPPLAIPYGLMSLGMTLLVAQYVLQVVASAATPGSR